MKASLDPLTMNAVTTAPRESALAEALSRLERASSDIGVCDEAKERRELCPTVVTAKPVSLSGGFGRDEATGRGAYYCIKELEARNGWYPSGVSVAIQGFGNAGQSIASLLHADGYRVVAVSDVKGGLLDAEGLDIPVLIKSKNRRDSFEDAHCGRSVCQCAHCDGGSARCGCEKCECPACGASPISNEELLELEVEILIPAAVENQITEENADRIYARYIIEIANGATTPEAGRVLNEKGLVVIADILARQNT